MDGKTYTIVKKGGYSGIRCADCGYISWNKNDVEYRYCGHCNEFHFVKEFRRSRSFLYRNFKAIIWPITLLGGLFYLFEPFVNDYAVSFWPLHAILRVCEGFVIGVGVAAVHFMTRYIYRRRKLSLYGKNQ